MTEKTGYFFRRILETIGNMLISSGVIYWLIVGGAIPDTTGMYITVFTVSATLFLALGYVNMRNHFWAMRFNIAKYLIVNLLVYALLAVISFIALKYGSDGVYTAFFGYTKPFRKIPGVSAVWSSVIFWTLYLAVILGVIVRTLYFDWEYKDICRMIAQKQRIEEDENL